MNLVECFEHVSDSSKQCITALIKFGIHIQKSHLTNNWRKMHGLPLMRRRNNGRRI